MRWLLIALLCFLLAPINAFADCTKEQVCGMIGKMDHFSILDKCPNAASFLASCKAGTLMEFEPLPEPQLVDNGDGTVTDTTNKLLWLQKGIVKRVKLKDAKKYAASAEAAGQAGWRIPTLPELVTLLVEYCPQCKKKNISGKKAFINPLFDDGVGHYYWTTTTCKDVTNIEDHYQKKICQEGDKAAWLVHFNIHAVFWSHTDKENFNIWLVKDL